MMLLMMPLRFFKGCKQALTPLNHWDHKLKPLKGSRPDFNAFKRNNRNYVRAPLPLKMF